MEVTGSLSDIVFQSTHPLRGATVDGVETSVDLDISIHAPLAGCDTHYDFSGGRGSLFQSTHPLRGATIIGAFAACSSVNFNPRTPCGVRPLYEGRQGDVSGFQSTHPLRGTTHLCYISGGDFVISIHAPLAGCDHQPDGR